MVLTYRTVPWHGNDVRITSPLWDYTVTGGFHSQMPVIWGFDVSCDVEFNFWTNSWVTGGQGISLFILGPDGAHLSLL